MDVLLNNKLRGFNPKLKMSDAKVSPIVGQEVWAAVSVVFCVAVILVFFFILCCAYRRHRRVRDLTMFTPPALNELGSHSTPWLVSNTKDTNEPTNKWTSGVWSASGDSSTLRRLNAQSQSLETLPCPQIPQRNNERSWFVATTRKETLLLYICKSCLFTFIGTRTASSRFGSMDVLVNEKLW